MTQKTLTLVLKKEEEVRLFEEGAIFVKRDGLLIPVFLDTETKRPFTIEKIDLTDEIPVFFPLAQQGLVLTHNENKSFNNEGFTTHQKANVNYELIKVDNERGYKLLASNRYSNVLMYSDTH